MLLLFLFSFFYPLGVTYLNKTRVSSRDELFRINTLKERNLFAKLSVTVRCASQELPAFVILPLFNPFNFLWTYWPKEISSRVTSSGTNRFDWFQSELKNLSPVTNAFQFSADDQSDTPTSCHTLLAIPLDSGFIWAIAATMFYKTTQNVLIFIHHGGEKSESNEWIYIRFHHFHSCIIFTPKTDLPISWFIRVYELIIIAIETCWSSVRWPHFRARLHELSALIIIGLARVSWIFVSLSQLLTRSGTRHSQMLQI